MAGSRYSTAVQRSCTRIRLGNVRVADGSGDADVVALNHPAVVDFNATSDRVALIHARRLSEAASADSATIGERGSGGIGQRQIAVVDRGKNAGVGCGDPAAIEHHEPATDGVALFAARRLLKGTAQSERTGVAEGAGIRIGQGQSVIAYRCINSDGRINFTAVVDHNAAGDRIVLRS